MTTARFGLMCLFCWLYSLAFYVQAETLTVEYKMFYSHVNKLDVEDTPALQFAFGFKNIQTNNLCQINQARISTDRKQIPLEVSGENRFTVPSEKALRLADALIIIDLVENTNVCDISVQLETKPEYLKSTYSAQELQSLYQQYQTFFDEMGGFMSFMMPQVEGLRFQFKDHTLSLSLSNGMIVEQGILTVTPIDFDSLVDVKLPSAPHRITAKTSK